MNVAAEPVADWNFGDLLDATAANVPFDRPALIQGARTVSWGDFDRRTNALARQMLARGLQTGDRVAVLARNIPEYIEIAAAVFKARLTYVNINFRYTTGEIKHVLSDSGARALFCQAEFDSVAAPLFDSLALVVRIGGGAAGQISYEAMLVGDATPLGIPRSSHDGYMLYTGGTTGKPKGLIWRSGDVRAVQLESPLNKSPAKTMADHVHNVRTVSVPGRVIPACPLMHGAGLNSSMAELVGGGAVILLPGDQFDAAELWDAAAQHAATRILIVGDVFARPMARALEANPGRWDLRALRAISSAGLMWSTEVKASLVASLPNVTLVDILGASEASGLGYAFTTAATSTPTGYFDIPSTTVIIDVETGRLLAPGKPGEGWVARCPPFAHAYHGDADKTAATFPVIDGVRYAIPGDLGERGADGRLRLIGRGNMCINTGGEKVFPEEVEEALKLLPGIDDALVLGTPDPQWGRVVAALVHADPGYDVAAARLALRATLASYKVPKHLFVVPEVPRHASGKGDYRAAAVLLEALLS